MTKFIISTFISIISFFSAIRTSAANESEYVFSVIKSSEPERVEDNPNKNRIPPKPITCIISHNEVNLSLTNTENIELYEVNDLNKQCIAAFSDEKDFIAFIFSIKGQVEIKFYIKEYVLQGYLSI